MVKFCINCGTQLEDNVYFCTNCGFKVESEESKILKKEPSKSILVKNSKNGISQYLIADNKDVLKEYLGKSGVKDLQNTLLIIENESGSEQAKSYFEYILNRINYVNNRKKEYKIEAKLADKVYKSYVTDGVSRLEKVNGRFMASQTVKLDMLVEQNEKIINLLEEISSKL